MGNERSGKWRGAGRKADERERGCEQTELKAAERDLSRAGVYRSGNGAVALAEIGFNLEQSNGLSRSAHILCILQCTYRTAGNLQEKPPTFHDSFIPFALNNTARNCFLVLLGQYAV